MSTDTTTTSNKSAPIRAETIMVSNVHCLRANMTIKQAIKLLVEKRIGGAPVVDASSTVISVVSEGDLMRLAAGLGLDITIQQCLPKLVKTDSLVTVKRLATFAEIYKKFLTQSIHRILVVDDRGKLQGLISRSNVLSLLIDFKEEELPTPGDNVKAPTAADSPKPG